MLSLLSWKRSLSLSTLALVVLAPLPAHGKLPSVKDPAIFAEKNWGLDNTESASHIHAREAWRFVMPKNEVVVAVIDTGIDPNHPLVKGHLWKKDGAPKDYGYDFVTKAANPTDVHGHGTHVAGIILATSGVTQGKSKVRIMPVRYFADSLSDSEQVSNTVKAIDYAVANGAKVINYSAEGPGFSRAEYQAIERAKAKGVLFVAAAGNRANDTDVASSPSYPASYDLSNIIAVAATNQRNELIPSSNWGPKHVQVAAPGENILSALPQGKWGYLSGTSQATAFVTGLAAMILSENPKLTPEQVRSIIEKSSDPVAGLKSKVAAAGRVNALAALTMARGDSKRVLSNVALTSAQP